MIRKEERRGQRILVIDIRYKKKDGTKARYRRDARVQTVPAATAEERRRLANLAQYGDVYEPKPEAQEEALEAPTSITFGEVVETWSVSAAGSDAVSRTFGTGGDFSLGRDPILVEARLDDHDRAVLLTTGVV